MFQEGISWHGPQNVLIWAVIQINDCNKAANQVFFYDAEKQQIRVQKSNPIENRQAWMNKAVGDRSEFKETTELQVKLAAIRDSNSTKQPSKYFQGTSNEVSC